MVVDATWPLSASSQGMVVEKAFTLGQDIATQPIKSWVIPPGIDAQTFKYKLLREHFAPESCSFNNL